MRRTRPSRPSPPGRPPRSIPGENVVLDGGSTNAALAEELKDFRGLSVATIGLTSLEALADAEDIEVILLGGRLRTVSQSFVGPVTEAALERMSFDRAFMGADGVRADRGICEKDLQQTRLKELMMSRADHVYVLAHGAKLGEAPFHAWAVMPARWTLVTDDSATAAAATHLQGGGRRGRRRRRRPGAAPRAPGPERAGRSTDRAAIAPA